MLALAEVRFLQGLQSHFRQKTVQRILATVSCVAALALLVTLVVSPSRNTKSASVVLLSSAPEPAEIHISDHEKLTIVGPFADEEEEPDPAEQEDKKEDKGQILRISGQGSVRGTVLKSRKGRDYNAFYQIPYARPPVGRYRFEVGTIFSELNNSGCHCCQN